MTHHTMIIWFGASFIVCISVAHCENRKDACNCRREVGSSDNGKKFHGVPFVYGMYMYICICRYNVQSPTKKYLPQSWNIASYCLVGRQVYYHVLYIVSFLLYKNRFFLEIYCTFKKFAMFIKSNSSLDYGPAQMSRLRNANFKTSTTLEVRLPLWWK